MLPYNNSTSYNKAIVCGPLIIGHPQDLPFFFLTGSNVKKEIDSYRACNYGV